MNECVRCGDVYTDRNNMGEFTCRYHVAELVDYATAYADANVYACCGVSPYVDNARYRDADAARGCHFAHHRVARHHALAPNTRDTDGRIRLPIKRALALLGASALAAESISIDESTSMVTISRHRCADRNVARFY